MFRGAPYLKHFIYTLTYKPNPTCISSVQELLLKDLPDPSQARRYSRRPSLNRPIHNVNYAMEVVNEIQTVSANWSGVGGCGDENGPRVVVEGLTASWEMGEASILKL